MFSSAHTNFAKSSSVGADSLSESEEEGDGDSEVALSSSSSEARWVFTASVFAGVCGSDTGAEELLVEEDEDAPSDIKQFVFALAGVGGSAFEAAAAETQVVEVEDTPFGCCLKDKYVLTASMFVGGCASVFAAEEELSGAEDASISGSNLAAN